MQARTTAPCPNSSTPLLLLTRVSVQVGKSCVGHEGFVLSVAFAPTPSAGRILLATGGSDNKVRLWDGATGHQLGPPLALHTRQVNCVAFGEVPGQGGLLLASGSTDGSVRLWDPATGNPLAQPIVIASPVKCVAFSAPGDPRLLLACGDDGGVVRLVDALSGAAVGSPVAAHSEGVTGLLFVREGSTLRLVTSSGDTTVRCVLRVCVHVLPVDTCPPDGNYVSARVYEGMFPCVCARVYGECARACAPPHEQAQMLGCGQRVHGVGQSRLAPVPGCCWLQARWCARPWATAAGPSLSLRLGAAHVSL